MLAAAARSCFRCAEDDDLRLFGVKLQAALDFAALIAFILAVATATTTLSWHSVLMTDFNSEIL